MKQLILILAFILSACGVAPATVDLGVVQTEAVLTAFAQQTENAPTITPVPPKPTATKKPIATTTPAPSIDELRQKILEAVASDLSGFRDVESVSLTRFNAGILEVELKTRWASQDRQADVSWSIVSLFAPVLTDFNKDNFELIAGGPFSFALTTYSTDGDYRYRSVTDWDTLKKIGDKSISYTEWVEASGAGFR